MLADLLHDGVDESTRLRKLVDAALHLLDGRVVLVDVERIALDLLDVRLQLALRTRATPLATS